MTLQIETDLLQRKLALDITQSFIVQAPAGSGKTELLIQRFLSLLPLVKRPEEILAITFTKKAANEMRARVIKALKQAYEAEPTSAHAKHTWHLAKRVLEHEQKLGWHLIDNPNQLRIQTIDSLCTFLTNQLPLLSHFGAQPEIAENPYYLYREAVEQTFAHIEQEGIWGDALAQLLLHLDNDLNKLHDLLVSLLAKRDQWLSYIHLEADEQTIREQLANHLALVIEDHLQHLKEIFPQELSSELLSIARFAATHASHDHPLRACLDLTALPDTTVKDKQAWLGLSKLLLTKSMTWRKRVDADIGFPALATIKNASEKNIHQSYRARLTQCIAQCVENEALRIALAELFYLPESHYTEAQWSILQALLQVLKILAAQLRISFQSHGKIDFIENAQAALLALGNAEHPTDLALALDYQIQHILIDEFQDTSITQYQLLEKLTMGWHPGDGRTLFVVGDPMQSIYKFREAEVGLFIRMRKQGLPHLPLTPITLSLNFRSTFNIVDWNNQHFAHIFPRYNDMATGAVTYTPSITTTITQTNSDIEIKGFVNTDAQQQAQHIANKITQTLKQYPEENIAILVRSRSHLATIIPALKHAKIRYRAIEIDALVEQPCIQDLFSLTSAMLHPADRIAWLAILRAPWCGLSLADLLIIGNDPTQLICQQLFTPSTIQKLSTDGQKRLARLLPILQTELAARERYPLREWIERTWYLIGGPATLNAAHELQNAAAYFELLENYSQQHPVLNVQKLKEKMQKLFAPATDTEAQVQLMTIHSAKGLEFDTVILPHIERKLPHDDKALLTWMERPLSQDQSALLLAPMHAIGDDKEVLYEYIARQQQMKGYFETDRLLYVATTRAKKRLGLYFNTQMNEQGEVRVESGSFLHKLWPIIEKHQEQILIATTTPEATTISTPARYIKRLTPMWKNPIQPLNISISNAQEQKPGLNLIRSPAQIVGIVCHLILQQLSRFGLAWWQQPSEQARTLYIENQLRQKGYAKHLLAGGTTFILNMLENVLADERGRWILAEHQDAQAEFALSAVIDNKMENVILDRTFIDEQGIRWIIDYKTTALSETDIQEFLLKEQAKYQSIMQKYHQAMRLLDQRPIRLGLYFPALPAWHEWGTE